MKRAMKMKSTEKLISKSVHGSYELDDGPGKYRIGLIALSNDLATERDFINMRNCDEIALFVTRIPNEDTCNVDNLRALQPELERATSLIIPGSRLDSIAYSCTSGTVVLGFDVVAESIHTARPGIPVVTPITAALEAFSVFSAEKIAVLTPYIDEVNTPIARYLEKSGIDIVAFTSFKIASNDVMSRTTPKAIYEAALQADHPQAQTLFISCTAIRAVDVIDEIEQAINKPVITANQALYWQALRAAGYEEPVEGFGRLLQN